MRDLRRCGSSGVWARPRARGAGVAILLLALAASLPGDETPAAVYSQDFEKVPEGKAPEEFLILNGEFAVRKIEGNTLLELSPYPLDSDGALFGPDQLTRGMICARVQAMATGKRFPEFGIGASGTGGYKLWLMPAAGEVQLLRGEQVVSRAPLKWTSGSWMRFKLGFARENDKARISGKVWADGAAEPEKWMVEFEDPKPLKPGRASIWANPYSGKPTRFDDLAVRPQ